MGTTANYSWPYPESSDFVADGATAIENLADAIDTTAAGFGNWTTFTPAFRFNANPIGGTLTGGRYAKVNDFIVIEAYVYQTTFAAGGTLAIDLPGGAGISPFLSQRVGTAALWDGNTATNHICSVVALNNYTMLFETDRFGGVTNVNPFSFNINTLMYMTIWTRSL